MNFGKIFNKKEGFTLFEMVVTLSILIMVMSIVVIGRDHGDRSISLNQSLQFVIQATAKAKGYALGGKTHDGTVSQGGFGVRFVKDENSLIIFADCNENVEYDAGGGATSCVASPSEGLSYPELFEIFSLHQAITIENLYADAQTNTLDITFIAPYPTVVFDPPLSVEDEARIILTAGGGSTRSIYINKLGITRLE